MSKVPLYATAFSCNRHLVYVESDAGDCEIQGMSLNLRILAFLVIYDAG